MTMTADMPKKRRRTGVPIPTAKQLADLREKLDISQTEMGKLFNVPLRTYQNWERGQRTPPGPAGIIYRLMINGQYP